MQPLWTIFLWKCREFLVNTPWKSFHDPWILGWQRTGINVQSSFHDSACNQISQSITVLITSKYTSQRPEFCRLLNCISPATLVITISLWQTIAIVTATCFSRVGAYFKKFWNPWIHCTFFIIFGLIIIYRVSNPNVHLYNYHYCLHCLLEYAT